MRNEKCVYLRAFYNPNGLIYCAYFGYKKEGNLLFSRLFYGRIEG
jgi:hypothetical protein